jgi:transposase
MTADLKAISEQVRAERSAIGRVSAELRRQILPAIEAAHEGGLTYSKIAKELGIREKLLIRWRWEERGVEQPARGVQSSNDGQATLLPVRLAGRASSRGSLTVHGPGGLRAEGLSVDEVAELFRRFA